MDYDEKQRILELAIQLDKHAAQLRAELLKYRSVRECRDAEGALAEASFPLRKARILLDRLAESNE